MEPVDKQMGLVLLQLLGNSSFELNHCKRHHALQLVHVDEAKVEELGVEIGEDVFERLVAAEELNA